MEFVKLQRQRAADEVYQALRQAIVNYHIKPGQRLDVEELSGKFGVSLTPVRGALQQLATEGLVEIRPRSGTFVASLTTQDVEETFQLRCALECLAAEEGLRNIGPQQLRRLKELVRLLRKPVVTEEDRKAHERDNSELHQIIVRSCSNRRLQENYDALNAHIKIARIHAADAGWRARLGEEQAEHEAIVAAIARGDADELCKALRKHISRAKDVLVGALRERESQAASE
jgi:DNA-binding GntR family transcriptional regulator